MYRLQFLNGKFKGKRLNVQQNKLTIGRDPGQNIDLDDDDEVSREHAVIEYRGGSPVIRDLGSINPVEVNNIQIKEHRLRHGDRIEIGRTVIEFLSGKSHASLERKHRFSKLQALSFFTIGMVVVLQVLFVLLFPLWQKREVVPIDPSIPPEPIEVEAEPPSVGMVQAPDDPVVPAGAEASGDAPVSSLPASIADLMDEPLAPAPDVAALEELFAETGAGTPISEDLPATDPLMEKAQRLVDDAADAVSRGELQRADNLLERAEMIAPDYTPAWAARGRLFEQRGMPLDADARWQKVMELAPGTPLFDEASDARRRIARATLKATEPEAPSRAEAPVAPAEPPRYTVNRDLEKRLRIHSVERERFQANEEFDEMRMVRVTVRPEVSEGAIDSSKVQLVIHFYDRLEGSSRVMLTRALVPSEPIRFSGEWEPGASRRTSATYILKRGFRESEQAELGEKRTYEGYRVSLYYDGVLQDESAMPRRLLDLPMPPEPEIR